MDPMLTFLFHLHLSEKHLHPLERTDLPALRMVAMAMASEVLTVASQKLLLLRMDYVSQTTAAIEEDLSCMPFSAIAVRVKLRSKAPSLWYRFFAI